MQADNLRSSNITYMNENAALHTGASNRSVGSPSPSMSSPSSCNSASSHHHHQQHQGQMRLPIMSNSTNIQTPARNSGSNGTEIDDVVVRMKSSHDRGQKENSRSPPALGERNEVKIETSPNVSYYPMQKQLNSPPTGSKSLLCDIYLLSAI